MTDSPFRYRGLQVAVDTTETAEFDRELYDITAAAFEAIGTSLARLPHSVDDRLVGDIRIREIDGIDVIFLLSREDATLVATIIGLRPPTPNDPTDAILKRLGTLAILRGASGL